MFGRHVVVPFTMILAGGFSIKVADTTLADAGRPNVLLIMTDDQGWGDIHAHGNPFVQTPAQDQLRREGASFERFLVSPVCAPTRASLLTGRYHIRCGVHGVTRGMENMRAEEVTLAEIFRVNGYATGCFGKWHNGRHFPYHPNGQGFDEFFGFCGGHWNNYFDTELEHNGDPRPTRGFITDVLTDAAMSFIEQHRERPFFCYVPFNAPHSPWQVPDAYWDRRMGDEVPAEARCAYAMVENIDDNISRLLARLDELELSDKTIVLFLTDNGPNSERFNGEMRGRKGSLHEGGVRVPLFVRWPGRIAPGRSISEVAMHVDLLPTLVDLCGLPQPKTLPLDGRSLKPLLLGEAVDWPDRMLCEFRTWVRQSGGLRGAVRSQRYRAVLEDPRIGWELYDMVTDPGETSNLAKALPEQLDAMKVAFAKVVDDVRPDELRPLPVPVGVRDRETIELPGHEALFIPEKAEGIGYNGRAGWANDWIDRWTDAGASPYWNLQVSYAGDYEVALLYAGSSGRKIRIAAGESFVEGTVPVAHEGKFLPSPDRIERKEVYERDWGRWTIGTIHLPAGEHALTLQALSPPEPGSEVLDIKSVILKRLGK